MPILADILHHKVLGREYKRGFLEGEFKIIRMQIERRFRPLPSWAEQCIRDMTTPNWRTSPTVFSRFKAWSTSCGSGETAKQRTGGQVFFGIDEANVCRLRPVVRGFSEYFGQTIYPVSV